MFIKYVHYVEMTKKNFTDAGFDDRPQSGLSRGLQIS